jgi:hypothetical protein
MKKVAIVQSNYIPWKGYFDLIAAVDEFILYDDVQFTKRDWRNRNLIKTPSGLKWLSVPVGQKTDRSIREVEIKDNRWQVKHWKSIYHAYKRAPHFDDVALWLAPLYLEETFTNISDLNRRFIQVICAYLDIDTLITNSWDYDLIDGKTERLKHLCLQSKATEYVTGPSAKTYLDEQVFNNAGVKVTLFDYADYPTYPQLWGTFTHQVSILDLIFNCGKQSARKLKVGMNTHKK